MNVLEYIIRAKDATASGIRSALDRVKSFVASVGRNLTNIKSGLEMFMGVVSRASKLLTKAFEFETMTLRFKTLIGSLKEAREHMKMLQELGDTPPFSLEEFAEASRTLMVMTENALGFKGSLELIGDAAAATGQSMDSLAHHVGLAFASIRDGAPITRATFALRSMGVITPAVAEKLEELQKSGASTIEIWETLETNLRRFKGAMKDTEKTADGLMGAISSQWNNALREFGAELLNVSKAGLSLVLEKLKALRSSGAITEWAKKARNAIYTVIGAFSELSKSGDKTTALSALKDVVVGAFEVAAQNCVKIIVKAVPLIGKMLGNAVKSFFSLDQWNKEVDKAKELGIEGVGYWDWSHDDHPEIERIRKAIIADEGKEAEKNLDFGTGTGRQKLERGLEYFKEIGKAAAKYREEMVKLEEEEEAKGESAPKTEEDERLRTQELLAKAQEEIDEKAAKAKAEKEAEEERKAAEKYAEEKEKYERELADWEERESERLLMEEERERLRIEQKIAAERHRYLQKELSEREKEEQEAQTALAEAQQRVRQAWGWYRDKDSLKAQLEEEKAEAEAQKQYVKDFENLKRWRSDWRTADNLSLDEEAVRRVALAKEEEASAQQAVLETAENTRRAADALEELLAAEEEGE